MSHDTLAEKASSSRSYLIRVEKGVHRPGPELRARIAVATDQALDFFEDRESDDDDEEADLVRQLITVLRQVIAHEAEKARTEQMP